MWLMGIVRFIFRTFFRLNITGLEKLDLTKPAIIAPNHVSLLDAVILAAFLPANVAYVINTDIAKRFAPMLRMHKLITVDPLNPFSVRHMVKAASSGIPLVIFPEGRVTVTNGMMKVYSGMGYVAIKTRAAVYPVAINGAERTKFSRVKGKIRTFPTAPLMVSIGEPFRLQPVPGKLMRMQKLEAAEHVRRKLQEHLLASRLKPGVQLFDEVVAASRLNGRRTVICEDMNQALTYKMLLVGAYALAAKLAPVLGERDGERPPVGVLLPNANAHIVTLLALFHMGATPAMLNFSAGRTVVLDAAETAGIKSVITSRQFVAKAKLEPLIEALTQRTSIVYLEDVRQSIGLAGKLGALCKERFAVKAKRPAAREIVLFTSGSEGKPKGVVLSHDNVYANIQQARGMIDITARDKILNALPLFHSFGLTAGAILPVVLGIPVYSYPSPLHYKVVPEIAYEKLATIMFGTSTFLAGYGKHAHPYDFFSLRYVFAGAEKLKPDVRALWMEKFGIRIMEGYGITETSPIAAINSPLAYRQGTVGQFVPGIEWRLEPVEGIASGGKLLLRGPNVMKGYLLHGQGFVVSGEWYDTGDIVEVDEDGFVTITARLKRFAKIGGEMVPLHAVEEAAARCFGIDDVADGKRAADGAAAGELAVVQIADARKGEKLVLFHTADHLAAERLRAYLAANGLSPLLMPAAFVRLDRLPLLGSGKTDYVALQRLAEERQGR